MLAEQLTAAELRVRVAEDEAAVLRNGEKAELNRVKKLEEALQSREEELGRCRGDILRPPPVWSPWPYP